MFVSVHYFLFIRYNMVLPGILVFVCIKYVEELSRADGVKKRLKGLSLHFQHIFIRSLYDFSIDLFYLSSTERRWHSFSWWDDELVSTGSVSDSDNNYLSVGVH